MKIIIATHNKHKIVEFKRILEPIGFEVLSQSEANIDVDIVEDGKTFAENSFKKAEAVKNAANCIAIADDSGICIDAFNGEPGIYSARFLGEDTPYTTKNAIVLDRMKNVLEENRGARYVCAISCIFPNGDTIAAEGICEGKIGYEPSGSNGFGYDPIFYIGEKSMAQMTDEEKDSISHRGIALREFVVKLTDYLKEV